MRWRTCAGTSSTACPSHLLSGPGYDSGSPPTGRLCRDAVPPAGELLPPAPCGSRAGGRVYFFTTATPAELVALPAASKALQTSVWVPTLALRGFQDVVKGAAELVPVRTPSTYSSTRVTPTLSAAFTVTDRLRLTVAPAVGEVMDTVGGVVSATGSLKLLIGTIRSHQ